MSFPFKKAITNLAAITALALTIFANADQEVPIILDSSANRIGIGKWWDLALRESGFADSTGVIDDIGSAYAFLVTQTPLSFLMELRFRESSPKAGQQGDEIGAKCLQAYPGNQWMQLNCLSRSIFLTMHQYGIEPTSEPCQSMTYAFERGFLKLHIPQAVVGILGSFGGREGHVFNRITFTDLHGNIYAYVIDVMSAPNVIFPLTQPTENFHLKNGRQKLPDFARSK